MDRYAVDIRGLGGHAWASFDNLASALGLVTKCADVRAKLPTDLRNTGQVELLRLGPPMVGFFGDDWTKRETLVCF